MVWCLSTMVSVTTMLSMHPCIPAVHGLISMSQQIAPYIQRPQQSFCNVFKTQIPINHNILYYDNEVLFQPSLSRHNYNQMSYGQLTPWALLTDLYVSLKWVIIGLSIGFSPLWYQAITSTNAELLNKSLMQRNYHSLAVNYQHILHKTLGNDLISPAWGYAHEYGIPSLRSLGQTQFTGDWPGILELIALDVNSWHKAWYFKQDRYYILRESIYIYIIFILNNGWHGLIS